MLAVLGSQRVWKPKFEKIEILVWPSLVFSNEIETSGGHISSTTAIWEVPLGVLDAPRIPQQKKSIFIEEKKVTRDIHGAHMVKSQAP